MKIYGMTRKIERRLKNIALNIQSVFQRNRNPYSEFVRLFNFYNGSNKAPEVLFLGDSVAERVSWNDVDKRTLSNMLSVKLKGISDIAAISYGGFTLKVFYYFLLGLEKMKCKPQFVVLPINMRNFSPQWDLEPQWQFTTVIEQINTFLKSSSDVPSVHRIKTESLTPDAYNEFDSVSVDYSLSSLDKIGQFRLLINSTPDTEEQRKFRLRQIFIFHYTNILRPEHPKLFFLLEAIKILKRMKIPFLAYITPLNIKAGVVFAGKSFSDILRVNVQTVLDLINPYCVNGQGCVENWSEYLGQEYFFHPDNATEHLNEMGRDILATWIADKIKIAMRK